MVKGNKLCMFDIFNTILTTIIAFITIFPFYYMVIVSIGTYEDIMNQVVYIIPKTINLSAYTLVFKTDFFVNSFFISVFVTIVGTLFSLLVSTMGAYTLSKKQIPGNKLMYTLVLIPLFFSGGMIPYYLTVQAVGLVNKIAVMIIPVALNVFYVILLKNFFEEMPISIEESAKIDGANDIYILFKIIIPNAAPVIATISLFYAVDRWNEYYNAMLFISDPEKYPLQLVLREVLTNFNMLRGGVLGASVMQQYKTTYEKSLQMAIVVVATIPIICIYPFLQKHFTKGILLGAIKE